MTATWATSAVTAGSVTFDSWRLLPLDVLRRGFSAQEARSQLDTAIDWGRYAELYDYDSDDEELTLEPGAADYL